MIDRKDTPAPSMQRSRPPPSLDIRPPMKHASYSDSPPRTPPYRIRTRGQRASKAHANRSTPRETYLNGLKDGDHVRGVRQEHRDQRISHDLSFSDNARHSVVDHMLLSLNPDQLKFGSTPPDQHSFPSHSRFASPKGSHRRGHTQSSSLNTDYAYPSDDSPLRSSGQLTRGRRSTSSSNFQSALGRIDSIQGGKNTLDRVRAATNQGQRKSSSEKAGALTSRKGRISNKSSGSSSVDFGHLVGQPRWQPTTGRRSSSFDQNRGSRGAYTLPLNPANSLLPHGASGPIHYSTSDPAPTPIIPASSPSRDRSLVFNPPPPYSSAQAPSIQRRDSNRSSKSQIQSRSKGGDANWDTLARVGDDFADAAHELQEAPLIPAFIISRNASPVRQPRDPSMGQKQSLVPQAKDSPKERPGFFRRVFGSSRNIPLSTPDVRTNPAQSSQNSIRADSRTGFTSPHKLYKPPPTEGATHLPKENAPPPLVKKPSSFFRRRKKSISEQYVTPVVPFQVQTHVKAEPTAAPADHSKGLSPVSSLREVMNPYLSNALPLQPHRNGSQGPVRSNHSSMGPSSNPALPKSLVERTVSSRGSGMSVDAAAISRTQHKGGTTLVRDSPRIKMKPNPNELATAPPHQSQLQASFLHDSSSAEISMSKSSDSNKSTHIDLAASSRVPPNLPVDATSTGETRKSAAKLKPTSSQLQHSVSDLGKSPDTQSIPIRSNKLIAASNASANSALNAGAKDRLLVARLTPAKKNILPPSSSGKSSRVWLEPANSHDDLPKLCQIELHREAPQVNPTSDYRSAFSTLQTEKVSDAKGKPDYPMSVVINRSAPDTDVIVLTAEDHLQAKKIYDGDEDFVPKTKAAAWLGEPELDRTRVRRAYMELFEWQNLNILASLRDFCSRLLLKGETQQVDRILDAFSTRWCACNPNHGFKATDVVHTICYSILLLNTDLHMAGIEQKMTRAQFIKNTIPTIRRVATDAAPDGFENPRSSTLPALRAGTGSTSERKQIPTFLSELPGGRRSFEASRPSYRLSTRPSDHSDEAYSTSGPPTPLDYETPVDDCGPLVKSEFRGKMTTWELQVEIVLKDFFNSIRQQSLPLHGNDIKENNPDHSVYPNSLSAITGNMLRRTPSMLSKAGSEHLSYRGRPIEHRLGTGRWTSKTRSRPRVYPASTGDSSRTSLEDQSSMWSPSVSSTWSKYSFGKTQTSMSIDSLASSFPQGDYQKSIGFANALSQAIIREESSGDAIEDNLRTAPLLEDESLELAGAPWAKEGILKHKHHLDSLDKKAKDRNWVESFAVIEKGWMRLFSFSMNAKSMRQKAKNQKAPGGVVGGGNWTDSAEALGKFLLRQTIASALPPPGYSKTRPHVWALSLPTGAVHLFQVGTPEIVKEFVTTANYWSARLSKEPLVGGVSNVEYGWSESIINAALLHNENIPPSTASIVGPRPSLQSSIRSSVDQSSFRPKLPGDKVVISDWTFPQQSMLASVLLEVDQLKALQTYVKNVEEELQNHNELRAAVALAFSPRHPNSSKAMANWERKSSYLLHEIVKFRTYIDCLQTAQAQKEKINAGKAPAAAPTSLLPAPAPAMKEMGKRKEAEEKKKGEECTTTINELGK